MTYLQLSQADQAKLLLLAIRLAPDQPTSEQARQRLIAMPAHLIAFMLENAQ